MDKNTNRGLTFDDIQLVPEYSEIQTRKNINLNSKLSKNFEVIIPIIASPMDTVCGYDMALRMMQLGGVGCIHRFMSIAEQVKIIKELKHKSYNDSDIINLWEPVHGKIPIMAAVGTNGSDNLQRIEKLIDYGANVLLIDVAHGHHKNVENTIKLIKDIDEDVDVVAGSIATAEAAEFLIQAGADAVRVGLGNGCFTPDMLVKTENGYKKIIDIQLGDRVLTHTNKLQTVIDKFEYERDEEIIEINGIECTKNHEFYVVHSDDIKFVNDGNIQHYAKWIPACELTDEYLLVELD